MPRQSVCPGRVRAQAECVPRQSVCPDRNAGCCTLFSPSPLADYTAAVAIKAAVTILSFLTVTHFLTHPVLSGETLSGNETAVRGAGG